MNIRAKLKALIEKRSTAIRIATWIYNNLQFGNKYHIGKTNTFKSSSVLIKKSKININGRQNVISISPGSRLNNCHIFVCGNNNKINIDDYCTLNNVEIWIEDDNNNVSIGEHTSFSGATHIACIEGSKVNIGKDCMFSANVTLRTGDSHSVTDLNGNRINPSKGITIGEHVWVGNSVIITKGVIVSNDSIVGTGSVVTRKFEDSNVVLAGNPAVVVKKEISWNRKRLPIKENL